MKVYEGSEDCTNTSHSSCNSSDLQVMCQYWHTNVACSPSLRRCP